MVTSKMSMPSFSSVTLSPAIRALIVVAIVGILAAIPGLYHARAVALQAVCASNMRQVSISLMMYADEYKGEYPPDLPALVSEGYLPEPAILQCPAMRDEHAYATSSDSQAAYIYIRPEALKEIKDPSTHIVLYESPTNHDGRGINVLYVDGHVEFVSYEQLSNELNRQGVELDMTD